MGSKAVSRVLLELRRRLLWLLPVAAIFGPAGSASAAELTFDLRVTQRQVPRNMRLIRVRQGDVVRLRFRSDQTLTLHLHGYEIERTVERGAVVEMTFTAHATGRFPVHIHDARGSAGRHSHEDAPLVRIEVYPQ
jgi:hypothetical protein